MNRSAPPSVDNFNDVLHILDKNLKYVEQLGIPAQTIHAYKKILAYLRGCSKADIENIFGVKSFDIKSKQQSAAEFLEISEKDILELSPARVFDIIADQKMPRRILEQVAAQRFGLTKGGISSLRTRSALVEKMVRMLEHEATHQSIARVASGASEKSLSAPHSPISGTLADDAMGDANKTDQTKL